MLFWIHLLNESTDRKWQNKVWFSELRGSFQSFFNCLIHSSYQFSHLSVFIWQKKRKRFQLAEHLAKLSKFYKNGLLSFHNVSHFLKHRNESANVNVVVVEMDWRDANHIWVSLVNLNVCTSLWNLFLTDRDTTFSELRIDNVNGHRELQRKLASSLMKVFRSDNGDGKFCSSLLRVLSEQSFHQVL